MSTCGSNWKLGKMGRDFFPQNVVNRGGVNLIGLYSRCGKLKGLIGIYSGRGKLIKGVRINQNVAK